MKEIAEILEAYDGLGGARCALATVVAVQGSSYRKPGARMLIAEDGRTWGGVSGGCLERDVARRALGVMETGRPVICRYDTADEQEDGFGPAGPALGCHGVIDIFVEPIVGDEETVPQALQSPDAAYRKNRPTVSATLVRVARGSLLPVASRFCFDSAELVDEPTRNQYSNVVDALRHAELNADPGVVTIPDSGDWFVERLSPPQRIVCFGAGPDVLPVVTMGQSLGWRMHVVVTRPAPRAAERFVGADELFVTDASDPALDLQIQPEDAVVLMTHNYPRDARILERILRGPLPRYIGILGPRHRTDRLLAEVAGGHRLDEIRLHAPIGLDLGAQNPEMIALAIVAEIAAVVGRGTGQMLRDRAVSDQRRRPTNEPAPARLRWSEACPT